MQRIILLGLLGTALAHPARVHKPWKPALSKRTVDLEQYRLHSNTSYFNAKVTSSDPAAKLFKRDSYVDAATALVQSVVPGAEFRVADHYVGSNGVAHVYFKQTLFGLDIDNSDFNVNIAKDGTVFSHGNSFYTGAVPETSPLRKRDYKDSVTALSGASSILELGVAADGATAEATGRIETYTIKGTSGAESDPEARLVYFVKEDGTLALTWRVETDISSDWLLSYVNAETTSEVHGVVNYVSHAVDVDATFLVYKWGINDPDEAVSYSSPRESISNPWGLDDSPLTWFNDGEETYTTTRGNNAIAQVDPEGETCGYSDSCYLDNYRPESSTYDFSYDYDTTISDPADYYDASIAQLFYTANTYHDLLYELGFTEASYNFQIDNEGLGGSGDDYVILNAQDGAGTNNADFSTPPDGQPGRMRMYLWTESSPVRDGAFEAGVIIHEYSHGLSTRLTGGGSNSNCLSGTESGGMGEGWGDFMATAIRIKEDDTRDTDYTIGAWVYNDPAGIRAYPFSTDMSTNPYTYSDVNGLFEVHAIGTIWTTVLYEVLWNLIDKYGKTSDPKPTLDADGVPTDGRFLAMKLVVDAMALQPCNPNMVEARDAILDADEALTGGENACEIWTGFAKRGLGEGAAYAVLRRTESFDVPSGFCIFFSSSPSFLTTPPSSILLFCPASRYMWHANAPTTIRDVMAMIRPRRWTPRGLVSGLLPQYFRRFKNPHELLGAPRTVKVPLDADVYHHYISRKQEKFSKALRLRTNNFLSAPPGQGIPKGSIWSVATGEWIPRDKMYPTHIFPPTLGETIFKYVTGYQTVWDGANGIFLPKPIKQALDDWAIVIVPKRPGRQGPRPNCPYIFRTMDHEYHSLSQPLYGLLKGAPEVTAKDLEGRQVQFNADNWPWAVSLYFHCCCSVWKKEYLADPNCNDPAEFWARFQEHMSSLWSKNYVKRVARHVTNVFNPLRKDLQPLEEASATITRGRSEEGPKAIQGKAEAATDAS